MMRESIGTGRERHGSGLDEGIPAVIRQILEERRLSMATLGSEWFFFGL